MSSPAAIAERLDRAVDELHAATKAAIALVRSQSDARKDDDEWARLMSRGGWRCPVTAWSAPTIRRAPGIRKKQVGRCTYYSRADARRLLAE